MRSFGAMLSLLCVLCVGSRAMSATHPADAIQDVKTIAFPEIKYADLVTQDVSAAKAVLEHLSSLGGLQITGIPRFAMSRKRALEDLAECLSDEQAAPSVVMADGARRVSTGAAARRGVAGEMDSVCGAGAARLRASVDSAMALVFSLLDSARPAAARTAPVMRPHYDDLVTLMAKGEHLEHLHAYYAPEKESETEREGEKPLRATLDFHVDAGLLIAMTTGLYSGADASPRSGLYVKLQDDSYARATAAEDALLVLLGDGGAQWLSAPLTGDNALALRALPHALVADLPAGRGASRSWYGKMYLPPGDALVPQTEPALSFAHYHALQSEHAAPLNGVRRGDDQRALRALLPAACGAALHDRYLLTVASTCPAGQLWCWARCMDASDLPCGSDAVCYNSHTDMPQNGDDHCMETGVPGGYCYPACLNGTSSNGTSAFCYGEGTSMYMTGFVSAVQEGAGNFECVNLLWPEWTLDTRVKFGFACLGVFLMCVLIQFITKYRAGLSIENPLLLRVANTLLFGVQITFSYFAMLVAMTYSVELFCMICAGLTVGYALFHSENGKAAQSDPCCPDENPLFEGKEKKEDCCASSMQYA